MLMLRDFPQSDLIAACPSSRWNSVSMNLRTYTAALFSVSFFPPLIFPIFPPLFRRDAVQHVTEPQAQSIGNAQTTHHGCGTLTALHQPYGCAMQAGHCTELS